MTKIDRSRALAVVAAAGLAMCLLVLVAVQPAEAAFPGGNGLIAFESSRDTGAQNIFTISPTGGATDRLTTFPFGHNIDPAVSPDGSRIAFSRDGEIWVMKATGMNPDGTGATQITDTSTAKTEPTWSSDGSRIAYVANSVDVDGQTDLEIWAINADGSGRTQLTNNTFPDSQPAWSPDGTQIAFVSARTGDTDRNIYVMDTDPATNDGTNLTPNTSDNPPYQGHDDHPDWSPDGTKIAYVGVAPLSTDRNIYVMDANGANQGSIDTDTAHDISPDWQPNPPTCDITGTNGDNTALNGTPADETICGLGGNDVINGGGGNDILMGGGGNDTLVVPSGRATLNGGDGADTASFAGSATDIEASLIDNFAQRVGTTPLEGAALVGIERLTGSGLDDVLEGSNKANNLVGGVGADTLLGLGGKDTLNSRDGVNRNDTVNGGSGDDRCVTDRREAEIRSC